jgi:FAD/FMN-containing dehydrogenase
VLGDWPHEQLVRGYVTFVDWAELRALRGGAAWRLPVYLDAERLSGRARRRRIDRPVRHRGAVVFPESDEDVAAAVRLAAQRGLRVAPQGTGHGAAALGPLAGTVLLRTDRLTGVSIDPAVPKARARAGARWSDVTAPADEHGLAALAGTASDVRVAGYTLGGGIGWLCRRHGLAANSVLAIDVVTADGTAVRADAESHPDLFWALRGGGGSFGVVTAMELALYRTPDIYAGVLFWPFERAAEVLHAWREWLPSVPEGSPRSGACSSSRRSPTSPSPARTLVRRRRGGRPRSRRGRRGGAPTAAGPRAGDGHGRPHRGIIVGAPARGLPGANGVVLGRGPGRRRGAATSGRTPRKS